MKTHADAAEAAKTEALSKAADAEAALAELQEEHGRLKRELAPHKRSEKKLWRRTHPKSTSVDSDLLFEEIEQSRKNGTASEEDYRLVRRIRDLNQRITSL